MSINHLDAQAVAQPGGLYGSINDGILESLQAYFQFKDRQQAGERDLRREERMGARQQQDDAVSMALRLGVRPTADRSGWMTPDGMTAVDAAVRQHSQTEEQNHQQSAFADLQRRAKELELVKQNGLDVMPPGMATADHVRAWQQAQQERALSAKRQKLADDLGAVRLESAKNEAQWNSPLMRSFRGVADWAGETAQEAVRASGRHKDPQIPGMSGAQIMLRDLDLAERTGQPYMGENNTVVPIDKIPAFRQALQQWVQTQGGQAAGQPVAQAQPNAMPASSGVDTTGKPVMRKEFMPEDGYDEATASALSAAGFYPDRVKEWTDAAIRDPVFFSQSVNQLSPVHRNAILQAVRYKAK